MDKLESHNVIYVIIIVTVLALLVNWFNKQERFCMTLQWPYDTESRPWLMPLSPASINSCVKMDMQEAGYGTPLFKAYRRPLY